MPFGYRGGSVGGYAAKLAVALGEAPGPEGIRSLLQAAYSYEAFVEALKSLEISGWVEDPSTPRGVELGVRRWVSTRLAQARLYAKGVYEYIYLAYSTYVAARDLTLLLRLAYHGEEPPPPDHLASQDNVLVRTVYSLFLETRSFRGIVDGLAKTPYLRVAHMIDRHLKVLGENGLDTAVDYIVAKEFNQLYRKHVELRYQLCPRIDLLYARTMLHLTLRKCPREIIAEFLEVMRPCKLPDISREALVGDPEALMLKLRSSYYGEITEQDVVTAFAHLEGLIRKEARRRAVMGVAYNPLTPRYAAAAHEYLVLDMYDVLLVANAAYTGAKPSDLEYIVSV